MNVALEQAGLCWKESLTYLNTTAWEASKGDVKMSSTVSFFFFSLALKHAISFVSFSLTGLCLSSLNAICSIISVDSTSNVRTNFQSCL